MNAPPRGPNLPPTTQAAEGLMRRRLSVAEVEAMVAAGIFSEDERFELIGGEIVPMSPKGIHHERLKSTLNIYWARRLPEDIIFSQETTFHLDEDSFVEPDFVFFPSSVGLANLSPETALLAVEVADSSLSYDLGRKARIYAAAGVRQLWVINAIKLTTRTHARPGIDGYADIANRKPKDALIPDFAPELAVALASLTLL